MDEDKILKSIQDGDKHVRRYVDENSQAIKEIRTNCFKEHTTVALMKKSIDNLSDSFETYVKEDKEWKEKLEKKFAAKWVERTMVALVSILVLAALYLILQSAGLPTP